MSRWIDRCPCGDYDDEIARLKAENERLREALMYWADGEPKVDPDELHPSWCWENDDDYHEPKSWECICGVTP